MSLIGIHIRDINDIVDLSKDKKYKKLNIIQTFVSATKDYTTQKYKDILKIIKQKKICVVIHISYSINLAKTWHETSWWIQQFISEIIAASNLNAFAVVVHTGKTLDLSNALAINNMYMALIYIHNKTKQYSNIKILIETPSGQGTEMLTNINNFCNFMTKLYKHPDKTINNRFGICIDTCHIFAAGYDIRSKTQVKNIIKIINSTIGIDKLKLCHINDSKKDLGSNIDRHDNIGNGKIGLDAIMYIVKVMKKIDVQIVLETPSSCIYDDYLLLST